MENKVGKTNLMSKINNVMASIPLEKMVDTIDMAINAFDEETRIREEEKKKNKLNGVTKLQSEPGQEGENKDTGGKNFISTAVFTLKAVKKIIELLIRWRPVANNALDTSTQTINNVKSAIAQPTSQTQPDTLPNEVENEDDMDSEENEVENEVDMDSGEKANLDLLEKMIDIAVDDGNLSEEEQQYILEYCEEIGVDGSSVLNRIQVQCL